MKRHVQVPGIRQWAAEDFLELQSEPLRAIDGFFGQYSPCVLKGCDLTDNGNGTYNLTAGLVTLSGTDAGGNRTFKVVPFSGLIGTPMPVYLTLAYSPVERQYVDGATKPIAYDYHAAATVVKPDTVPFLELKADSIPRFEDVIQDSSHRFMTDKERDKLLHATTYIHPKTHPASMIVFDDGETLQYKYDLSQQVSYEYTLEVTPALLAFGAAGEVKGLSVSSFRTKFVGGVSTGEREQVDYTAAVISGTDVFSIQDVAVTAGANNTEASRSGAILVTQEGSGKTATVSLSQAAGEVTWEYAFSVVPTSLDYTNSAGSKAVNVVSNKQKKINGISSGSPVSVGFASAVSSGTDVFSVNGNTISAAANNTEAQRSGSVTFTQAESNRKISVALTQAAGDVTWEYTLSVTPKTLSFETSGGTQEVSVTSYKRKYINGSYTGEQVNVGCTASVEGSGFSVSGTGITAGRNSILLDRTGTAIYTQSESNKTASVSLNQAKGYDDFNIAVREGPNVVLYDTNGNKLNEARNADDILRMATDDYYVYALCGNDTAYYIKLYDFLLNEVDSIILPGMKAPLNLQYDLIVAGRKKVMFHSMNNGGGNTHRMGFVDLNKNKDVHYVDVSFADTTCARMEFFYDEATGSFYSRGRDVSKVVKLNEDTYEWEDTGYSSFTSDRPCDRTSYEVSFINGLGNAICSSGTLHNSTSGDLTYVYNNKSGNVVYRTEDNERIAYYVMLNRNTPFVYTVDENKSIKIGTIRDLMAPVVETKKIDIKAGRYGLFPMYKHPYKNIMLIPVSNTGIPKICVYDYEADTYDIIQCTYEAKSQFFCNAVTVPSVK